MLTNKIRCWPIKRWAIHLIADVRPARVLPFAPKQGFPGDSDGKDSTCDAGDLGLIPGLGRSPGEGYGLLFQYSCLENYMDRGAWWARLQSMGLQRVGHDWVTFIAPRKFLVVASLSVWVIGWGWEQATKQQTWNIRETRLCCCLPAKIWSCLFLQHNPGYLDAELCARQIILIEQFSNSHLPSKF